MWHPGYWNLRSIRYNIYCAIPCLIKSTYLLLQVYVLHKKPSFPLKNSSLNVTKSAENCGFGHIYWRNPEKKTSRFGQSCQPFIEEKYANCRFSYAAFWLDDKGKFAKTRVSLAIKVMLKRKTCDVTTPQLSQVILRIPYPISDE